MSITVKFKLIGDSAFSEFSTPAVDKFQLFSDDGGISVGTKRSFISMCVILSNLNTHLNTSVKKSLGDVTHIEVVDTHELFMPAKGESQDLICLDYCQTNRNNTPGGGNTNSYFDNGNLSKLQSFVCKYPCLFSPYYTCCFTNSSTLTNISLNLQPESDNTDVVIPSLTFNDSQIITFESSNVTHVNSDAFRCCYALQRVFLPRCTTIGNGGFRACVGLKYLSIPSIKTIINMMPIDYLTNSNLSNMTIGQTASLNFLVLPDRSTDDDAMTFIFTSSEIKQLRHLVEQNNGTVKLLGTDDISSYIWSNLPRDDACQVSILDIDATTGHISCDVISSHTGSSVMPASCFQNISFDYVNGQPVNFSFSVPESPIPFLPILPSNISIADDFINATLAKMGVSLSSANVASIVSYKANLLADINTKIKNLLETKQQIIGQTLFSFVTGSDRVVLTTGTTSTITGKMSMIVGDKIKFRIKLFSSNGVTYNQSYEIVYSLT